jgi:FlgD Ig-like domain
MPMLPRPIPLRFPVTIFAAATLTLGAFHECRATTPSHLWSQRFGDANAQGATAVATDASGNVYVTGNNYGTINFGGGDLTSTGGADIFLVKFNSAGVFQWSHQYGDASDQTGFDVGTDGAGNVYLGGLFKGSVNFGGGTLTGADNQDIFLAKFSSAGVHLWSKGFGDVNDQFLTSMAVNPAGDVYATGYFLGTVDFGGGPLTQTGLYNAFLAEFDTNGAHLWSKQFGDAATQYGMAVALDRLGNVYLAGGFSGVINLGGSNLTSAGDLDAYLAKFDSSGNHQWSNRYGDVATQVGDALATDYSGRVLMTGYDTGSVDFGGGPLVGAGGEDVFLVKFDAGGAHQWSHIFGDAGTQSGAAVATDSANNVYLAGNFDGTMNLGGGNLVGQGGTDFFAGKFDASGVHQWSQRYGDSSKYQILNGATIDRFNNFVMVGFFQGSVDFGGGPLTATGASYDVFVAKLGSPISGVRETPNEALSISSYPNPFNPETTVRYSLSAKGHVTLDVYDARGMHVATLVDGENGAGAHTSTWNGRDEHGAPVGSGVYFLQLATPAGTRSTKITLLK